MSLSFAPGIAIRPVPLPRLVAPCRLKYRPEKPLGLDPAGGGNLRTHAGDCEQIPARSREVSNALHVRACGVIMTQ